jgi:hypothetical protein
MGRLYSGRSLLFARGPSSGKGRSTRNLPSEMRSMACSGMNQSPRHRESPGGSRSVAGLLELDGASEDSRSWTHREHSTHHAIRNMGKHAGASPPPSATAWLVVCLSLTLCHAAAGGIGRSFYTTLSSHFAARQGRERATWNPRWLGRFHWESRDRRNRSHWAWNSDDAVNPSSREAIPLCGLPQAVTQPGEWRYCRYAGCWCSTLRSDPDD